MEYPIMIAGRDFPDLFQDDNFTSRRTTGNNMYDPESLLTGAEAAAGFTYDNSRRNYNAARTVWALRAAGYVPSPEQRYLDAVEGCVPVEAIPVVFPRVLLADAAREWNEQLEQAKMLVS